MKMKVLIFFVLLLFIYSCSNNKKNSYQIGAVITLTGDVSYWALELKKGMDLAIPDSIEIVYEDNRFNASSAISALNKLLINDNPNVIISCFTPMCEAIAPVADSNNIPLLMTITSANNIASEGEWLFRDYITQEQQCPPLAKYVFKNLGLRKGAYLVLNDDYGKDGIDVFSREFIQLGGEIVGGETFIRGEQTVRNKILKLLKNNPEFIFLIAGDQSLTMAFKQIKELNPEIQVIGLTAFDSEDVWKTIGNSGNGVVFSSGYFNLADSAANVFLRSYMDKYGVKPNATNVFGYSIVKYLSEIIIESNGNKELIKEKIKNLDVNSIRGKLQINSSSDILSPIGIYKHTNSTDSLLYVE